MIFKQETIQSWFSGVGSSINNEVIQPFQNAEQVIWKYNQAIQHNSLTQQGWERLLAQSDDSLKAYLTSIKGTTATMTGYNVSLQGNIIGFKKVSSAITQYNALSASGTKEQNMFANAVSVTNGKLGTYLTGLNGAKASLGGYVISLVGASVKTVALKVATIALNSAITMGASLIISGVVSAISEWIHKTENMISASEDAIEKIKSINDELKNNQKTISDTAKRYAELAQGVDQLTGKNISLSNEDYEEFLTLSNQLAEMFPTLTRNYNDNGDAIVQLSGDVDTIVGSLQNLIEAQRDLANRQIVDELPTVFDGVAAKSDKYEQQLSDLESRRDALVKSLGDVQSEEFSANFMDGFSNKWIEISGDNLEVISQMRDDYIKILEEANIDFEELTPTYEMKDGIEVPVGFTIKINSSDEDVEKAKSTIDGKIQELASQYETDINKLNEEINTTNEKNKANWTSLSSSIFAWLSTDDSFKVMDDTMQATVQNIVNNLDYEKLNFSSWEEAKQYIQENILSFFNTSEGKETLEDIEVMFGIQTQFNNGNIPVEQYQQKLQEFLNSIETLPPETKKSILLLFGIQTNDDGTTTSDVDTMVENVKKKLKGTEFDDKVGELSLEDLKIAANLEVGDDTIQSWDELIDRIEKVKSETFNNKTDTSFITDAVDSLEDTKKALSSLDNLYSQTVLKNASGDGIVNGFASPDTINAVESAFGGIAEEDAKVASALQEFEETLVKFPNDSEKAQDAINNLVTAYIDQTDILQDLTEENKEWAKAQLKAMGITNAEEVVESRLNQKIKKNIEAFGKYKESVADYSKKLSTLDNTDEGYSDALEGMRAGFEELFNSMNQFKDENGEVITVPISTEFAQNNLEDLMAAANGSTEALDRLQAAATADYIVQCGINVPSGAKEGLRSRMNSLISQIQSEIEDVEIGAQLDNTQAISSLVQLAKQAGLSSEQVKNALSSIGVAPQISYKDMEVPDLEENIKEYNGHPVFGGYKVKEYKKVKLPIVKYSKISSGTGTGAIYGGGSSNNSSGGGGGGSSSDTQKDPTQFDWIETAITRAEESISRLDKVIDNTYQNWFDRNVAVGNKIKQVSNEIDLQKKAYQGYMNKANSIGLADVYKQKVQNGAIQIEDIADENLAKKIEDYKNWYEKAIACKDAIKDLNTTLSDLAKMRFDNVVKQFEEIEQVFTDANDLIQKRLEYAEERGLIASKAYYQGMIANSKKNRQHLAKQLTRMQEELNKGVASGSIKKGSEEWYSMTQEIEKTKQAIVETDTEIQKFANDIRQIDWDIFDLGQEMISNVIDETDFLNSLIEKRDNLTDGTKSRGLTNDGIALLGTHSSNYNMYMAKNQEYAKKIKEINNQLANDPTNQDLINQKDEYIKAQRESILAAEDEKQAMIDLARQGYDAVLANMQELIDKRKEYLNQEKSIYEYQKNISEQTKNIASLRKQLAVYENDNSEESRKKVQQLKVSIQEAEQNLKDTEYDKYISDQEEMLDKIYQDYSDAIDEKFENIDSLFKELISIVNKFDNNIQNTLYHTAQDAGYNLSEEIKGIWSGDAKFTISSFSKNFSTYATNVQKVLSSIWNKIDYMTYVSWVDYNKQSGGTTNNKVTKQHASGLKKSTSDYLAWTQENGAEIVRTKDGALLYPVTSGTTIFTSDMTDNLWNFAKNPFEFISGIPSTISYSNHINNENNISLTIGDIRLDGVQNPEQFASQFISAMQNNSKLRKALQSSTIDLLAGKNSKRINNF